MMNKIKFVTGINTRNECFYADRMKNKGGRLLLTLFMTVFSQPLFAFVGCDLMTFSFFTARHVQ